MGCCCERRSADTSTPLAQGDYQIVTLPTSAAAGQVTRQRVELGRRWTSFVVTELPDAALAQLIRLHLGATDEGIPLVHRGQRIEVAPGFAGELTAERYIEFSSDGDISAWTADVQLLASDAVRVEMEAASAAAVEAVVGTIDATGEYSIGPAAPGVVSRWAIQLDFSTFTGTVNFGGRVVAGVGSLVPVHYINLTDGLIATADLDGSSDVIVLVDASGLGDLVLDVTRSAGSVTYRAQPLKG